MANWQRTLDVSDVWDDGDIPTIAKLAADRLEKIDPFPEGSDEEETRLDLIEELREVADDPEASPRDFDYVWEHVYDWADTSLDGNWNGKKVCWIKTF
jgi:hypothetical protein